VNEAVAGRDDVVEEDSVDTTRAQVRVGLFGALVRDHLERALPQKFPRERGRERPNPASRERIEARRGLIDFKVVCDEKNNTPEVIDSNRFVADIYIKPNRSINFIQLNFIATRTGVNFSEVGA
jgi:hypothetical protein